METDEQQAAWSPSALFALAQDAVESTVDGTVHVRGRVVDTSSSRNGTQFVTLVDEDVERPAWDTPRLGLVVFAWRARWLERPLGGPVSRALTTGTVIDAVGEFGLAPGRGGLQLRTESIAIASDSADAAAVAALRDRIERERWVDARPPLPPVLRRVGALISVAGDGDLDEALRLLEHDPAAPAFCRHRIHPLSATSVTDVPALLDHHVAAGVDAVLIAFGGHLPPVSAWDSAPVLEAVQRAHLAGVPVVAGFAHGRDQPLTKLVAHNHAQASAAVTALVQHNRSFLGRIDRVVHEVVGQVEGATARVAATAGTSLRRTAATPSAVATARTRQLTTELERVASVTDEVARRDLLAARLPAVVAALADPRADLTRRLHTTTAQAALVGDRLRQRLEDQHDAAGRISGLLRRGFALVTDAEGRPLGDDRPPAGSRIAVTTATSDFTATVDAPTARTDTAPEHTDG